MTVTTDLLYEITGEAMSIQREKGPDHVESVYHDLLAARLRMKGHKVEYKPSIWMKDDQSVYHDLLAARLRMKGHKVEYKPSIWMKDDLGVYIKKYQPDLRVHQQEVSVLVELKASATHLSPADERQARAYLSVSPQDEAVLLLNFGHKPFEQKRVYQHRSEVRQA